MVRSSAPITPAGEATSRSTEIRGLDEVFVAITGQRQYLWRAVDQDGDLIDLLVQPRLEDSSANSFSDRNRVVS